MIIIVLMLLYAGTRKTERQTTKALEQQSHFPGLPDLADFKRQLKKATTPDALEKIFRDFNRVADLPRQRAARFATAISDKIKTLKLGDRLEVATAAFRMRPDDQKYREIVRSTEK